MVVMTNLRLREARQLSQIIWPLDNKTKTQKTDFTLVPPFFLLYHPTNCWAQSKLSTKFYLFSTWSALQTIFFIQFVLNISSAEDIAGNKGKERSKSHLHGGCGGRRQSQS